MYTKIIHADLFTPYEHLLDQTMELKDGKIYAIFPSSVKISANAENHKEGTFDARGLMIAPGLIDIHIHGCMGADTMDANQESLSKMSIFLGSHGITSFLATTVTNSQENIQAALSAIARFQNDLPGARLLGAHIEGPYINIAYKGAQNPRFFRGPHEEEYREWIESGMVKLITIAPELDGMDKFIEFCTSHDIELAIGHSQANYDQVIHAANLGVRQATHLFNGMLGLHHREPGTVGAILTDERIYAQIITDGIHLHPAIVKLTIAAKGVEKTILISDAMRATGLENGKYDLGGQEVTVVDGEARIANGALAGSTLTLDAAVRNTMRFSNLDFQHVLPMATSVPAKALRIDHRKGNIQAGHDADLTFFDENYQVAATMVRGELIFHSREFE